jgi:hypothetical protein
MLYRKAWLFAGMTASINDIKDNERGLILVGWAA